MKKIALESASIDDLIKLRDKISSVIKKRVELERSELQARLLQLQTIPGTMGRAQIIARRGRVAKGRKVPIKYRNPNNRKDAWSGRGRTPRWMVAAIKATGKKIEDFKV